MTAAHPAAEHPLAGIAFMLASVFLMACMDAMIKHLVADNAVMVVVFWRASMTLLVLLPYVVRQGGWSVLRMQRPGLHGLRIASAVIALVAFFEALRHMELATATVIGLAAPLVMTALSVPLLKERVGIHRWSAVIVGFIGVLVIVRPGGGLQPWGTAMMVAATLFFALSQVLVRLMARTETNAAMLVYPNVGSLVIAAVTLPFVWHVPNLPDIAWIAIMAVVLVFAQYMVIRAFRLAPVGLIAPFQYFQLAFAAAFGWMFWNETAGPNVWVGATIIIASGLYVLHRQRVLAR